MGNFLRERLFKTRHSIFGRIKELLTGRDAVGDMKGEIEEILITSDISSKTAGDILKDVFEQQKGVDKDAFIAAVKNRILSMFEGIECREDFPPSKPWILMVVGVNGTGKTTTIGKMAGAWTKNGKKGILAACDTFRAAAIEQLEVWGEKSGCRVVKQKIGSDPASVAFDSLRAAEAQESDFLILDTAGRLHTKHNLMEELKKVKRVLGKNNENFPHEVLLVLDATFGQNAMAQVREFNEILGLTGIIMTKLDGTAKGGTLLSVANEYKLPVKYIGVGEGSEDLLPFDSKEFVDAIFS